MIENLEKLSSSERLELYLHFIKNKNLYAKKEREELETYFEDG